MPNYDASIRVNTKVDNSDLRKLEQSFEKVEQAANIVNQKIKQQEGNWDNLSAKAEDYKTRLRALEDKGFGFGDKKYDDLYISWKNAEYALKNYQDTLNSRTDKGIAEQAARVAKEQERLATAVRKTQSGFFATEKSSKKCFQTIQKGTKQSNSLLSTMGTRLKGIALSLLVFNWITKGFNAMVGAMKEGLQNLAHYSGEYNAAMSELKGQASQLKNSLAAAFEPIANVIIPYLSQFVAWLNVAADAVAQFMAAMQGKSTYTKAKKQVLDYAKALDKATGSAKKALASFDELNVLGEKGTVSASGELKGADAFETAKVSLQFDDGWKDVGRTIGNFLNEIEWKDVFLSTGNFFEKAWNAAVDLWKGSFDANPIGTIIVSGLALASFSGLGSVLWNKISTAFAATVAGHSIGFVPTVLISAITWQIGFDVGKSLGKALFPEDAEWYDNFSWFGEEGFFTTVFGTEPEILFDAFREMSRDWGGLIGLLDRLKQATGGSKLEFEDLFLGLDDLVDKYGLLIKDWINEDVKPYFSKEKWSGILKGIKEAFSLTFKNAVNAAAERVNRLIDEINKKMKIDLKPINFMGKEISSGGSIQLFSLPKVPMLADGAVIQGGKPFAAILGDQPAGQTNIETPLSTMIEAFKQAMAENGAGGMGEVTVIAQLDGQVLFKETVRQDQIYYNATGKSAYEH